jgi:hypothetical protein
MPLRFITFLSRRAYFVTIPQILLATFAEQSLACRGFTNHRFEVSAVFHIYLVLSAGKLVLHSPHLLLYTMKKSVAFSS